MRWMPLSHLEVHHYLGEFPGLGTIQQQLVYLLSSFY